MKNKIYLLPRHLKILSQLGENIRLARLRRKMSTEQVAQRAGISRMTLYSIEQGAPTTSLGNYFQVLVALGLDSDFLMIAKDDDLGRKLQDANLSTAKRAPKRK